jgi:hypothetical protein
MKNELLLKNAAQILGLQLKTGLTAHAEQQTQRIASTQNASMRCFYALRIATQQHSTTNSV